MSKISFNEVLKECNNEPNFVISPNCKTENKGYFTCLRVDKSRVPKGWFVYEIRHGDGGGFCTIEPSVLVDHAGTFLTQKEINFGNKGYKGLSGRGGYSFLYRKENK